MPNLSNYTDTRKGTLTTTRTQWYYKGGLTPNYPSTKVVENKAYQMVINRSGTTTPGFADASRKGPLPTNSFSYSKVETWFSTGSLMTLEQPRSNYISYGHVVEAGVFGESPTMSAGPVVSAAEYSAMVRTAQNKLLERVKHQKINLMHAYAERAQTKALVADSLMKLAKAVGRVRKGDVLGAAKALGVSPRVQRAPGRKSARKHVASNWLELQYGWKPLVSDIYGAAEAYQRFLQKRPQVEKATSQASAQDFRTWGPFETATNTRTEYRQEEVTVKFGAYFSASGGTSKTLSELGITNPAMVAWELLPWSFVVDWFLPVGDFLNNLDATQGVSFSGGYMVVVRKQQSGSVWTAKSDSVYTRTGVREATQKALRIERSKLNGFPSPRFPAFKDPYSHTHFANALALLITNSRK